MTAPDAASGRRSRFDSILIVLFVCALSAPWIDELVRTDKQRGPQENEQRPASARPVLEANSLQSYPEQYTEYFNDSFGLRDWMLRWHSIVKYFVFGVSPTSQVVLGQDGWMFYTGDKSIEAFRGMVPFTKQELRDWQHMLEVKRDTLKAKGIEYLFVIGPNKESIYPEHMSPRFNSIQPLTRMDQLVAFLKQHSDIEIVDLRPALIADRAHDGPGNYLYYQLGTHWNGRGCYASYREIIDRVGKRFPRVKPTAMADLQRFEVAGCGDSWAKNMYIPDLIPQQEVQYLPAEPKRAQQVLDSGWGIGRRHWFEVDDATLPRAVMFHDSFGAYIDTLMAEHFSRFACFWQYQYDPRVIVSEKPEVVIELFVERTLVAYPATALMPRAEDLHEEAFAKSSEVVFHLDIARDAAAFKALGHTEVHTEQDDSGPAIVIETKDPSDTFLLPEFEFPASNRFIARLVMTTAARSMLSVYYKRAEEPDYQRRNACLIPLLKGQNDVYFEVDQPRLSGPLRVRTGDRPGRFVLQSFEVRALPPR